jgi:hypothetical protein
LRVTSRGLGDVYKRQPINSTDSTFDEAGFYLLDSTYRFTAAGTAPLRALPSSGLIQSVATTGLSFQLAPSAGSNSMRISTSNAPKTLAFATPVSASQVIILGSTGSGQGIMTVVVNFTDGSNQTFTSQSLPDWFGGTGFAIQRIGRVNNLNTQPTGTAVTIDPRLYQKVLTLNAANYTKLVSGITVTRTSTSGVLNIMAVSIATPPLGMNSTNEIAGSIHLIPNPVVDDFSIEVEGIKNLTNEKITCTIYNMIGEKIYSQAGYLNGQGRIQVRPENNLNAGIYMLETNLLGKTKIQKFLVK